MKTDENVLVSIDSHSVMCVFTHLVRKRSCMDSTENFTNLLEVFA